MNMNVAAASFPASSTLTGLALVNRELADRFLPQFAKGLAIGTAIVVALVFMVMLARASTLPLKPVCWPQIAHAEEAKAEQVLIVGDEPLSTTDDEPIGPTTPQLPVDGAEQRPGHPKTPEAPPSNWAFQAVI
jgi:hypothetical protein